MSPTVKCARCPAPVEPGEHLCPACSFDLAHHIFASEPDPQYPHCAVCKAPFSYVDARVLRFVKDPSAKLSHETPLLCWVCARLHHAVITFQQLMIVEAQVCDTIAVLDAFFRQRSSQSFASSAEFGISELPVA